MKNETELKNDAQFAQILAQTLDASLHDIDELNLQRLKKARTHALSSSTRSSSKWIALSVAASLLMLVAAPAIWQQKNVQNVAELNAELISADAPLGAQELDDIDMLMAMDDGDV